MALAANPVLSLTIPLPAAPTPTTPATSAAPPVARPGLTALETCSFATNVCKSACCANLAPIPALAPAPTRSAGRRFILDAPITITIAGLVEFNTPIAISPIPELVECFMADIVTFDNRKYLVEPFDGDPMQWDRFEQDFNIAMILPYAKDDNEYNLSQTLKGTDIGGANNTVPLALTAGLDPAVHQERTQHLRWHVCRKQ